jgi:hypothetical protein
VNSDVFWDIAQCSSYVGRRFVGTSVQIRTTGRYIEESFAYSSAGTTVHVEPWPHSSAIARYCSRSCDFSLQFLTPFSFKRSSAKSSHLKASLPTRRVASESVPLLYRNSPLQVPPREPLIY